MTFSALYSSTGLWADDGWPSQTTTYNWTLMQAEGAGTLLDLSGIQSIDAGFNSTGNDHDYQKINALDGGVIDLSGVQWVEAPNDGYDRIEFNVTGGTLDLSSLSSLQSAASGAVHVNISDGGNARMGCVSIDAPTTINIGADSILSLGCLQGDSSVNITLSADTARLEVDDFMRLCDNIDITAGGIITLGGDFTHTHADGNTANLGLLNLECVGDIQRIEVGGIYRYLLWDELPDDNFGFQQLTIGQEGQPSEVGLIDTYDNLEAGIPDALYLFGIPGTPGVPGLRILGGSTLYIGDIEVFVRLDANDDGTIEEDEGIALQELFTGGETVIPFDQGYISLETMYPLADMNCDGYVTFDDINAFVLAIVGEDEYLAEYPDCNWLNADIDGNGDVNFDDINPFVDLLVGC